MTERATKLSLTYYRFSASAETLRLAAAIGKIPFTNRAIEESQWEPPPGKELDPRYKLPVLEIEVKGREKTIIAQRNAILHYLGKRGGLYPADPLEGLQIEYMLDTVSEALRPLEISNDGAVTSLLSDAPWTNEEVLKIREGIGKNSASGLPHYLLFFEKALRENYENKQSKWLVGTNVSIADLKLYQLVCWISGGIGDGDGPSLLRGIESSLIEGYPLLLKHKMQIETLPEVLSWRAKYTPPYTVFEYRPPFEFRSIGRRSRLETHPPPMHPAAGRLSITSTGASARNASFPRLTLTYFDLAGRAEPIRLAAAIGKVPFTNRSMSREDWADTKRFSPLKQLPTLTVVEPGKDLVTAPQSTAILRYIGNLGGIYPLDEIEAVQVEFMMETISDALRLVEMTVTGVVKSLILDVLCCNEEQRETIQRRVLCNKYCGLPLYLNYFEGVLSGNKPHGWLVGKSLTIADLSLYHISSWLAGSPGGGVFDGELCSLDSPLLEDYPLIRQHMESIEKNPRVARFREQHKAPYPTFDFVPGSDDTGGSNKKARDNLPKGVRRRPSTDAFPKNFSRSKSSDQIPKAAMRRPGFSPPTPAKRRSSRDDVEQQQELEPQKKGDKMMSAPPRRRGSFDSITIDNSTEAPVEAEEEPRRKSRGNSMPPRPRPVSIIHFEDDYVNFSDSDESADSAELNGSASSFTGTDAITKSPTRKKHHEFWDDSSSESFDDESSFSSVEGDLKALKKRLKAPLEKKKEVSQPQGPAPYNWKADRKRRMKKEKKRKASKSKRLPANIPRNQPPKRSSKASLPRPTERIDLKEDIKQMSQQTETAETEATTNAPSPKEPAIPPSTTDGKKEREDSDAKRKKKSPKSSKRTARLPTTSPRGIKKFPSNDARSSSRSNQKPEGLNEEQDCERILEAEEDEPGATPPSLLPFRGEIEKSGSFNLKKKRVLLIYFSLPGRAESIRLAAVLAQLPFTNLSMNPEDTAAAHKHMAPLGQFPVLEIEEAHNRRLTVPQSMAILRYLGMLGDLYPEDPLEALAVDSMCDCVGDALRLIETTCRSSCRSILEFKEFSDEECVEMRKRIAQEDGGILRFLSFFEKELENNVSRFGVWIAQSQLSIADLRLYQLLSWLGGSFGACLNGDNLDGMPGNILKGFPMLELHKERVEEIPEVVSFRSQFKIPYSTFDFYPDEESEDGEIDLTGDCSYSIADKAEHPRLTLTHSSSTLDGEAIRLAAAIGKTQFTNKLIEPESSEWKNVYGRRVKVSQLPLLEIEEPGIDKKFVIQPLAILRYFCKLGNLYPNEPIRALEVESMIETITEIHNLISVSLDEDIQCIMSGSAWSENETWSVRRRIAKSKEHGLPFYLTYFEKAITENFNSSWLVGPTLTMADLCLYSFLSFFAGDDSNGEGRDHNHRLSGLPDNFLDDYPVLRGHRQDIEKLPAVMSFRGKFYPPNKTFTFRPTA